MINNHIQHIKIKNNIESMIKENPIYNQTYNNIKWLYYIIGLYKIWNTYQIYYQIEAI